MNQWPRSHVSISSIEMLWNAEHGNLILGVFRSLLVWKMDTVALLFLFGKNDPIMNYLGLKDSSRQLRANCAISNSFYLHLMLHACAARFDVTENLEKFWILGGI